MSPFPRDLLPGLSSLHRFSGRPEEEAGETEDEEEEAGDGIELSLGLSLNGLFGVDPMRAKMNLSRSSSIPDFLSPPTAAEAAFSAPISRTCSMPAWTVDEECRKRKEIQNLRRLEAKRKRTQKLRSCSVWDCAPGEDHGTNSVVEGIDRIHLLPRTLSQQGSVGSQGSGTGSSGISTEDFQQQIHVAESKPKSPALPGCTIFTSSILPNRHGLPPKGGGARTAARNVLEEMPFVFTKGDGPDGKRVEGFLYRYRKGEEVSIVCVCHGSFLSPAEFVKHAGGGDVANPMRRIVVLPSSVL